jgi:hypothetical protein
MATGSDSGCASSWGDEQAAAVKQTNDAESNHETDPS